MKPVISDDVKRDLEKRGVAIAAFIVQNEEKQVQLISYDENGVVAFITDFVDVLDINERLEGRMIRPMATIGKKQK